MKRIRREERAKYMRMLREAVDYYLKQGFCLIPIKFLDKAPAIPSWEQFQKRKPTKEDVERWFFKGDLQNVGVVCGAVSGNLVVVDFDDPKIYKKLFGKAGMKETLVVKTAKGIHLYFRTDFPVRSFKIRELSIDVKAEGGYVLAPPSKHPSGKSYKTESHPLDEEKQIMHIPGDFKQELLLWLKTAVKSFDPKQHRETVEISELLEGVEEGFRNEAAIRVASWFRKKKFDKEKAWEQLKIWNKRNTPPLMEEELKIVLSSAYDRDEVYEYRFTESVEREFFTNEEVKEAEKLLQQPDIIPFLIEKALGDVVKETELKTWLFFLNLIGQSVQVHGTTSTGKSHTCDKVLSCFPKHTWFKVTGVTDKAIRYLPENIHTLYLTEWRAAQSGQKDVESTAEFDIKLVISEGKLRIIVVERNEEGKMETRIIETSIDNIVSTSTAVSIPRELLNRIWEMTTDETINPEVVNHKIEQRMTLKHKRRDCSKYRKILRCAIEILRKEAPKEVIIPFADKLKPLLEPIMHEPRVRRDVDKLLDAVYAVALLHYRNRPIIEDESGERHIICLPQDFFYAWVYGHEAIVGTFTGRTKRTEEVVEVLKMMWEEEISITSTNLASLLKLTREGAYKWLKKLEDENVLGRLPEKEGTNIVYQLTEKSDGKIKITIKLSKLFDATESWLEKHGCGTSVLQKPEFKKFYEEKIVTAFPGTEVLSLKERIKKLKTEELGLKENY